MDIKSNKKILFFIFSMQCGGAQRVAVMLFEHWIKSGYDVVLVTISSETSYYHLPDGLKTYTLKLDKKSRNIFDGVRANTRRIFALRTILKREQPDVAVAFMTEANIFIALASLFLSVRVIGSERVHPPHASLKRVWEFGRKYLYRYLDTVVVQTERSAQWILKNTNAKEVAIISNPLIYPLAGKGDNKLKIDNSKKILLAVGRLNMQKGFDILIDAFAEVALKHRDWKLYILGEGPERVNLETQISLHNVSQQVVLIGNTNYMGNWYEAASLYVMSSRYEGFPNALLEAMSYGLPCVSFDCPTGPAEIIHHGIDGILVPNGSCKDLTNTLDIMMSDANLRAKLATNALDVRNRFSKDRVLKEFDRILNV